MSRAAFQRQNDARNSASGRASRIERAAIDGSNALGKAIPAVWHRMDERRTRGFTQRGDGLPSDDQGQHDFVLLDDPDGPTIHVYDVFFSWSIDNSRFVIAFK